MQISTPPLAAALTRWLSQNVNLIDLVWTILIFAFGLIKFTRRAWPMHHIQFKRVFRPIRGHIFVGVFETLRYHIKALSGPVKPDVFDWVSCIVVSYCVLDIVWDTGRGHRVVLRPCHQAVAVLRILFGTLAFMLANPELHRASIKYDNMFAHARWVITLLRALQVYDNYSHVYTTAIFISAILCSAESRSPWGIPIYFTALVCVININGWTAKKLEKTSLKESTLLVRSLAFFGFVNYDTLKNHVEVAESSKSEYEKSVHDKSLQAKAAASKAAETKAQ
ncbi:hypothetical protein BX600DRAFT_467905 [Xylariales sp. PMI_506]|nr:hypothetical protein BX600DRAFT_467905 [Xylariales sp. PMI_506]